MKELLVPCGNMDSLHIAVKSGADAVYLGGKKFGARAFANNFSDEEMVEAIKFCHLYGVKIFVTVNTLIYESELDDALNYLNFLYASGVDAVIIQDIGLMVCARKYLPDLEIHASTQVHNTNEDGIKFLENLGIKRVVFARELSVDEIDNIKTSMEKEAFIHGALCIAYSGQCLFSSMLMDRSGNRGSCAQMCRLPFKLKKDNTYVNTEGDYLLSTKELNTAKVFKRVMESSIYSLKIEGRMKSPEYVGCVTKLYRDLIDKYNRGEEVVADPELLYDIEVIFNRDYTYGFLFNSSNEELMNIKTSNHLGVRIGKVIDKDKKYIYIKLERDLNQGDGIRFTTSNEGMIANYIYDKRGNLISSGKKGEVILVDNRFNIKVLEIVNKTLDINIENKYRNCNSKKIDIDIKFVAKLDSLMSLSITDGENSVKVNYGKVIKAESAPISRDRILSQLNRLGNTPFRLNKCDIDIDDNIFIVIKDINEIRRMAIDKLIELREYKNVHNLEVINKEKEINNSNYDEKVCLSVLVRNEEQLQASLDSYVDRIYVTDKKLYNKYKDNKSIMFRTNRVNDSSLEKGLITELGALNRIRSGIGDYYLNVCNHETVNYLSKYLDLLTISVELSDEEIEALMNYYDNRLNVEMLVYGYVELMITKYCPLNLNVNKDSKCHICTNDDKYYFVDRNNKEFRIIQDKDIHLTHIMNYKPLDKINNISYYHSLGINNFRIELLNEDYDEANKIIKSLKNSLEV